jgi:hypothetical protein
MKRAGSRKQWLLAMALVAAVVSGLAVYAALMPHQVPATQRALLALNADNLGQLKDAFNAENGHARVIAFLSPT